MNKLFFMIMLFTKTVIYFNKFELEPLCVKEFKMGICQNDFAYTIAQSLSFQICSEKLNLNNNLIDKPIAYSPDNMINYFEECNSNKKEFKSYLDFVEQKGLYIEKDISFNNLFYNGLFDKNKVRYDTDIKIKYENIYLDTSISKIKKLILTSNHIINIIFYCILIRWFKV